MKKRILSLSLVFAMLLAMAPAVAAADPVTIIVEANDHVLITEKGYKQFSHGETEPAEIPYQGEYVIRTENPGVQTPCYICIYCTERPTSGSGPWEQVTVTLDNVNLIGISETTYTEAKETPMAIGSDTGYRTGNGYAIDVTIKLKGENTLQGICTETPYWSGGGAGLSVIRDAGWSPAAIIEGPGSLTAIGGKNAAGIGCGAGDQNMGTVTINSGTVTAIGGAGGAGIGHGNHLVDGWRNSSSSNEAGHININGGIVTAIGTENPDFPSDASTPCGAAGIGWGYGKGTQNLGFWIKMNGGVVTAKGVGQAACIGGTYRTNIYLTGGTIKTDASEIEADCAEIGLYTSDYSDNKYYDTATNTGNAIIYVSSADKISGFKPFNPDTPNDTSGKNAICVVYETSTGKGKAYTLFYPSDYHIAFTEADDFSIPNDMTLEVTKNSVLVLPKDSKRLVDGKIIGEGSVEMDGARYYIDSAEKTVKPYAVKDAGGIYHKTLADAFAEGAYTQSLIADVTYDGTVFTVIGGSNDNGLLLDLNGYTINLNGGQINADLEESQYDSNDRFTLRDNSAEKTGKITGNSANAVVLSPDGKLVIEGGAYENTGSGPAVQFSGTVKGNNLKGGTFSKIEYTGNPLVGALASGYGFRQAGENGETWWIAADSGQSVLEDVTVAQITGTLPAITPTLTASADSVSMTEVSGGTYQWYEGGSAISGATGPVLPFSEVAMGTHTVTCHVTAGGVTVASDPAQVTGTKPTEAVRITITGDPSKTYDGAAAMLGANGYTVTPAGVTAKVEYTAKDSGSFSSAAPVNAGSYTVRVTAGGETAVKDFTIFQAKPNVGDVSCSTAIHLSTVPAAVSLTHSGTTGGTVKLAGNTVFTLGTKDYDWTFTPTDTVNYTTDAGTITLTVTQAALSDIAVTAQPTKKTYTFGEPFDPDGMVVTATYEDGTTAAVTPAFNRVLAVGQTTLVLSYTEGGVTRTVELSGLTVNKKAAAPLSAKASARYDNTDTQSFDFGALLPADCGAVSGVTVSDVTSSAILASAAGDNDTKTVAWALKSGLAGEERSETVTVTVSTENYTDITIDLEITATVKTPVSITGVIARSGTYSGQAHTGYTGIPAAAGYSGDFTVTYSGGSAPVNAGSYFVTIAIPEDDAAYTGSVTLPFQVEKAAVTVKADDKTATVGQTRPRLTTTVTGLADGEVLKTQPVLTCNANMAVAGSYEITASGAAVPDSGNYQDEIIYQSGTLTVSASGSGGSSSGGGGGSSSDDSGGSSTRNPDGSTTTKTENKTTGTVTETTRNPDGSQTVVETRTDGTVTTTDRAADGSTATVTTDASGKTEATVELSAKAVSNAAGRTVTLPMTGVSATRSAETAPVVTVNTGSSDPVKVEIPTSNVTPGTVAVIVRADGTEEIVKSSVATEKGVAVSLSDGATVKIVENSKAFADVPANNWAADAVSFSSARELFSGTSEATFSPDEPMTRAMMVTVLARFDGEDTAGGATWYEKGVDWAVANGVSDGANPNSNITREQLVTMLWRYAGSPSASGSLSRFTDAGQTSGFAQEAMSWAVENGIINGYGSGQLGPQGDATRAQVAQMLKNFIEA